MIVRFVTSESGLSAGSATLKQRGLAFHLSDEQIEPGRIQVRLVLSATGKSGAEAERMEGIVRRWFKAHPVG